MIQRGDIRWFRFASPDKRRPVLVLGRNQRRRPALHGGDSSPEFVPIQVVVKLVDVIRQRTQDLAGKLRALVLGQLFGKLDDPGQAIGRHG